MTVSTRGAVSNLLRGTTYDIPSTWYSDSGIMFALTPDRLRALLQAASALADSKLANIAWMRDVANAEMWRRRGRNRSDSVGTACRRSRRAFGPGGRSVAADGAIRIHIWIAEATGDGVLAQMVTALRDQLIPAISAQSSITAWSTPVPGDRKRT